MLRPVRASLAPPSLAPVCALALALSVCEPPERPPAPEPVEAEPDPRLESDAWPVWAPAMQVPGCRDDAQALRELVERAHGDPVHVHQARRRLAELEVCLERQRVELPVETDTVFRTELELDAEPPLHPAIEARRERFEACVRAADGSPEGELRLRVEVGDRARVESVTVERSTLGEGLVGCLTRVAQTAPIDALEAPPVGTHAVGLTVRAGDAFTRPCVQDRDAPRHGVRIARVALSPDNGGQPWDDDGTGPDLHVFLYYRGLQLTSVISEDAVPAEGAITVDLTHDPRAVLRCPVAVSEDRPIGVLVVEFDDGRDHVVGWAESALAEPEQELGAGLARVTLRRED